jgi:phosphatidylethanolamine-binding protein (PEBP) family uncharacterized protein
MRRLALLTAALSLLVFGCAGAKVAPDAAQLGVDFSWKDTKPCSRVSPVIRVSGFPASTKMFKVSLKDLDVPDWNHGGGTCANDGSGVIPRGALKDGYNGPCPPSGAHSYRFTVKAVDKDGTIVGMGKRTKRFPP